MGSEGKTAAKAVGFYTVVAHEQHGLFGGYLLLNAAGRPLEFHCTAPVKPNRAQEILYGASLESYLYGEAIGGALLSQATQSATFLCVELPAALAVREFVDLPVALVPADDTSTPGVGDAVASELPLFRVDSAHDRGLHRFQAAGRALAVPRRYSADADTLAERVAALAEHFDLREPFARIRGAIEEAQRSGR